MKNIFRFAFALALLCCPQPAAAQQDEHSILVAGDAAADKKQWARAIALYTKALAMDPKNKQVLYARAYSEYYATKYDAAAKDLEKAQELAPSDAGVKTLLGDVRDQQDRYTDAIAAYSAALALQTDTDKKVALLRSRASAESSLDRLAAAIADYQQALTLKPNDTMTLHSLANAYYASGNDAATEKMLQAALTSAPHDSWSYEHLGIYRWLRRRYNESLGYFSTAISLKPKDAQLYQNRAVVYVSNGSLAPALADNAKAMSLDKTSGPYDNRAILYWIAGKPADAITAFGVAIRKGSDDALANRGALYLSLGRNAEAAADLQSVYNRYAKKNYHNSYAASALAIAYRRLHQNNRALAVLRGARSGPEGWPNPVLAFLRGELSSTALIAAVQTDGERSDAYTYIALDAAARGGTPSRSNLQWVAAHANTLDWDLFFARSLLAGTR